MSRSSSPFYCLIVELEYVLKILAIDNHTNKADTLGSCGNLTATVRSNRHSEREG